MPTLATPVSERDFHQGALDAPIQLVHFGDFECPYSAALSESIAQLQAEEGAHLLSVFRPFPLQGVHPHALIAARAAYAAQEQGGFWPMYEMLFQNQNALDPSSLEGYAHVLGLDEPRFAADLRGHKFDAPIEAALSDAQASGAHGTPTVFVNGHFHDNREGMWKLERLREVVRAI